MIFNNHQPIYIQILELINDKILSEEWGADERIPSVRDLAMKYEVNPNTVMRAYDRLQSDEIIYKRRGIGYYLSPDAREKTFLYYKNEFINSELPKVFAKLKTFSITMNELEEIYSKFGTAQNVE